MTDSNNWVALTYRFTPGWPWPESSWGLDPMYGPDGWCHGCGSPLAEQIGPLVLQSRKFPTSAVWVPNWRYDCVGVSAELAVEVARGFNVPMREVVKPRGVATGAMQLLPAQCTSRWYDDAPLQEAVLAQHRRTSGDRTGQTCTSCGRLRWLPINEGSAQIKRAGLDDRSAMLSSPETFGDGCKTFRHLLFRRELGELLAAAAPHVFSIVEVAIDG